MDERENVLAIAKRYSELVKAGNFPMEIIKSYLFGSFAQGTPHKDSDIDIAFIVKNCHGNYYYDIIVPVGALRRKIDLRIEPHIIDPSKDYSNFMLELERTGIEL